jgi:hypothetical protein
MSRRWLAIIDNSFAMMRRDKGIQVDWLAIADNFFAIAEDYQSIFSVNKFDKSLNKVFLIKRILTLKFQRDSFIFYGKFTKNSA